MRQTVRRLPGIRFESQPPPAATVLPRMDVAGFVGFASSGPLHVPVQIEDAAQFADVFGPDAPLAWDPERHGEARAHLGPAVRAFFRNGGDRCWVVRVADAGQAQTNRFPLPGIVAVRGGAEGAAVVGQAELAARSPGSGSDGLLVSASIVPDPVRVRVVLAGGEVTFDALLASAAELVQGDVVRVTFAESDWTLLFAVSGLRQAAAGSPPEAPGLHRFTGEGGTPCWVRVAAVDEGAPGELRYPELLGSPAIPARTGPSVASGLVELSIPVLPAAAPAPGTVVEATLGGRTLWLEVAEVRATPDGTTALLVTPFEIRFEPPAPMPVQAVQALAERLQLDLRVAGEQGEVWALGGLGLAAGHPSFVGMLPADERLYGADAPSLRAGPLAQAASSPRFPLAGPADPPAMCVPLGASIIPGPQLGALAAPQPPRVRDGLERFGASVFLDPALAATSAQILLEEASWIRDQSPSPRPLTGIHSLLAIDEVTIVAVPDAVHRPWVTAAASSPLPPPAGASPPELSPPELEPQPSGFCDCAAHIPAVPELSLPAEPAAGVYTLSWSATDVPGAVYELQEASDPGFGDAATLYRGPRHEFAVYGRAAGASWWYRVRVAAPAPSGWSASTNVLTGPSERNVLDSATVYSPADLRRVQLALLRMCAARGDLLAVLALPEHYGDREALAYVQGLGPDPVLGFGALYHPWLYCTDAANPAVVRAAPPDGAAAGVVAARAAGRGAWVAPANEPLLDVVALDRPIAPDAYAAMQAAQVNVVRDAPGGFLWLAADTLSAEEDLRPIGVRRLLALLRRVALLHGAAYAFEPNSDVLARTVKRAFERTLTRMYSLRAFAGATAAEGFRVNVLAPQDAELIVELQVAPSRPLSFITVRLVRSGAGALQVEVR